MRGHMHSFRIRMIKYGLMKVFFMVSIKIRLLMCSCSVGMCSEIVKLMKTFD